MTDYITEAHRLITRLKELETDEWMLNERIIKAKSAMETVESWHVSQGLDGTNAEARKAQLAQLVADDTAYQEARRDSERATHDLAYCRIEINESRRRLQLHIAVVARPELQVVAA